MKSKICNEDIIIREIHGQFVFMSKNNTDICTLNDTGSFIFKQLESQASLDDVVNEVMSEFEIDDAAQVQKDVQNLIQSLLDNNIVPAQAVASFQQ